MLRLTLAVGLDLFHLPDMGTPDPDMGGIMAGHGPAPKPAHRRAGHSPSDPTALRVLTAAPMAQPRLPIIMVGKKRFAWPAVTQQWWAMWAASPLSDDFTSTDWSELRDTAKLHAEFWQGNSKVASELRLRVAKFGATPEDRARLRITFAQANEADEKRPVAPSSRARRGALKALPAVGQ